MSYSRKQSILRLLPIALPIGGLFSAGAVVTVLQSFGFMIPVPAIQPGVEVWKQMLSESWHWISIFHSIVMAISSAALCVIFGTILAWLIHRMPRGWKQVSTIYKIPLILPHLTVAYLVMMLFSQSGFFSSILASWGIIHSTAEFPNILYSGHGLGIILAYVIKGSSFVILMDIALLRKLDENLITAASMLGASWIAIFKDIVLPHLKPAMLSCFAILSCYTFGAFEIPWLIGESRPQMLSITVFNLYFHRDLSQRPHATALLTLLMILSFCIIYAFLHLERHRRRKI